MFSTCWQFIPPPATVKGHGIFFCLVVHHTGWIICSYFCFAQGIRHFSFAQELAGRHPQKGEVCQHWACEEAGRSAVPLTVTAGSVPRSSHLLPGDKIFHFSFPVLLPVYLRNIYFGLLMVQKASKSWLEKCRSVNYRVS